MLSFRIAGLDPAPFRSLYGLSDAELAERNVIRYHVDRSPGFPDRVELRDLKSGEVALLVNYAHLDVATPFRQSHAIFVREEAQQARVFVGEIPPLLRTRFLSVRAYDAGGMMRDADLVEGVAIEALIERLFADPAVAYVDAHNAKRGCFVARIERA